MHLYPYTHTHTLVFRSNDWEKQNEVKKNLEHGVQLN